MSLATDTTSTSPTVAPSSTVEQVRPEFEDRRLEWRKMRDVLRGATAIKNADELYLPMPSGFTVQPDAGVLAYDAYKTRADTLDMMPPTLGGMVGLIHHNEWKIEGLEEGKPLADMWEKATKEGLPLEVFAREVTKEILLTGRYGILSDLPTEGADVPWLVGYTTETVRNWSDERDMYVLDESRLVHPEGNDFGWEERKKYRVLRFADDTYTQQVYDQPDLTNGEEVVEPKARADKKLEEIPFVVAGPRTVSPDPENPPLLGVAEACISFYQLSADYRHQLFMSGQETLFGFGIPADKMPTVVGAGVSHSFSESTSRVEYVGPKGVGIEAHRVAMEDQEKRGLAAGAQLFNQTEAPSESGVAKELRFTAQTATLATIAMTSAAALEKALRFCAIFVGQDPEEVIVTPDLEFVAAQMTPAEAVQLLQVWQSGMLSYETVYAALQRGRLASQERTAEEEQELIDQENPDAGLAGGDLGAGAPPGAGGAPAGGGGAPGSATDEEVDALFGDTSRFVEDGTGLKVT